MALVSSISFLLNALRGEVTALGPVFFLDKDVKKGSVLPEPIIAVVVKVKIILPRRRKSKSEVRGRGMSLDNEFLLHGTNIGKNLVELYYGSKRWQFSFKRYNTAVRI